MAGIVIVPKQHTFLFLSWKRKLIHVKSIMPHKSLYVVKCSVVFNSHSVYGKREERDLSEAQNRHPRLNGGKMNTGGHEDGRVDGEGEKMAPSVGSL